MPLPVWQVGGKTRTEVLGLGWQSLGELGSALPRVLTLALPLTNPGPPWTQSILSLSLSSAVGFPVWLPHPSFTILITDKHYLSNVSMDMSLTNSGGGEGQGSLACCSPWGRKGSDTTERLNNNRYVSLTTDQCSAKRIPGIIPFSLHDPLPQSKNHLVNPDLADSKCDPLMVQSHFLYHYLSHASPWASCPWQWTNLLLFLASGFRVSTLLPTLTLKFPWGPMWSGPCLPFQIHLLPGFPELSLL